MTSKKTNDSNDEISVAEGAPAVWSKYDVYHVKVDPLQDDRATELRMFSFDRPHMRAFHVCWWCFFMAFCLWFTIVPCLPEIRKSLKLTKEQLWTSQIIAVTGTVFVRFMFGPLCDKFGPRTFMSMVLVLCSIPVACIGLVNSYQGLVVIRLFIGLVGGSFVMCQAWMSKMFAREIVGTANAIAAGWGNLGGGVILLFTGSFLFPVFKNAFNGDAERTWRTINIIPAVMGCVSGIACYFVSDDCPRGNFTEVKKMGAMAEVSAAASFRAAMINLNSWFLFLHYAACFGVEITMNNAAALYFTDQFGQTVAAASFIASLVGWMNLFARAFGGMLSDYAYAGMGMKGRMMSQAAVLLSEGCCILMFARTSTLSGSIVMMVVLALFIQLGEGTTFGIVPFVDPPATGSISGIVGAGGNVGAVAFNIAFRQLSYTDAFTAMGAFVIVSAFTTWGLVLKGHKGLLWGEDDNTKVRAVLEVPEKDVKGAKGDDHSEVHVEM